LGVKMIKSRNINIDILADRLRIKAIKKSPFLKNKPIVDWDRLHHNTQRLWRKAVRDGESTTRRR